MLQRLLSMHFVHLQVELGHCPNARLGNSEPLNAH